jgi:hypothetical protein
LFNFLVRLWGGKASRRPTGDPQAPRLEALEDRLMPHGGANQALTPTAPDSAGACSPAKTSVLLPIAPRIQWNEHGGYCGETCVQSFALYYGEYISQYEVRALYGPTQKVKSQFLVGAPDHRDQKVLGDLHLTSQEWNDNESGPQYQDYLAWVKQELSSGHPVIGTVYINGLHDSDYDHIVPFVGYQSAQDGTAYHPGDHLLFYDNFSLKTISRSFSSLPATRTQANQGSHEYYLPQQVDYGVAVTGIVDPNHETVPVQLSINRSSEPDPFAKPPPQPVTLKGTLTISSLVPGQSYTLLRYDDPTKVPDSHFLAAGGYASEQQFTATATVQTLYDTFSSDGCVIYRCVPASTACH